MPRYTTAALDHPVDMRIIRLCADRLISTGWNAALNDQNLNIATTLETLVVDEADLVLSFGYEDDLRRLLPHLPKVVQTFLMSATLSSVIPPAWLARPLARPLFAATPRGLTKLCTRV